MKPVSRRRFSKSLLSASIGFAAAPAFLRGQKLNGKWGVAVVGSGGRGGGNVSAVGATENIVALCDVNGNNLTAAAAKFPKAAKFTDFRKLFDKPQDFDAV